MMYAQVPNQFVMPFQEVKANSTKPAFEPQMMNFGTIGHG
jgi:hypothetical protein